MPSSGARSGTRPNRPKAAGDGRVGAAKLKCGHETHGLPIAVYPGGRKLYRCPDGCGLQRSR